MALFQLEPEHGTLVGSFSREYPPILTVDPGDTVVCRTLDAGWGMAPPGIDREDRFFQPRTPGRDDGHALTGPIEIRGARPGAVLEVQIGTLWPGTWGWTWANPRFSDWNQQFGLDGDGDGFLWQLDPDAMIGRTEEGYTIALRPFMGILGLPPDEPGVHPTMPPRFCGGNMDCRELVAGSTLFLPITVPGALFCVGDGHAAQGDGEVCTTALECMMDRVELTFHLRDDLRLSAPRAYTPAGWITLGFGTVLDDAARMAMEGMLELMGELWGLTREKALALASVVVDLRITQVCTGVPGVHALLPHGAVRCP
jgi:acetamidase/formamidase